jgi:hypothetical protein
MSAYRSEPHGHRGTHRIPRWAAALTLITAFALIPDGRAWVTESDGSGSSQDLAVLYRLGHTYSSAGAAIAGGYVAAAPCTADEDSDAPMHFAHPRLLAEPVIALDHPQVLLFEMRRHGGTRLRAVAYRVGQRAWHSAGNPLRPTLLGIAFELVEHAREEPFYVLAIGVFTTDRWSRFDHRWVQPLASAASSALDCPPS